MPTARPGTYIGATLALATWAAVFGGCDTRPTSDGAVTEHCGDPAFAADHTTLCFGGCKDPVIRETAACVPCAGAPDDPLCGGSVGTSGSSGSTDDGSGIETVGATESGSESESGSSSSGAPASCGDDNLDPGEECDDGNRVGGDRCEADCTLPVAQTPVELLTSGSSFSCAVAGSQVKCWGDLQPATGSGFIGGIAPPAARFPELDLGGTVVDISAGFTHACALLDDDTVRCWGTGGVGMLGYGNILDIGDDETPASAGAVDVGSGVVQVAAAGANSCARFADGTVRCWGSGMFGLLGLPGLLEDIGDDEAPSSVGPIDLGGDAIALGIGIDVACALLDDGDVVCWGLNAFGAAGYGHTNIVGDDESPAMAGPVDVGGTVVELAVGGQGVCVRLDDDAVRCWGRNQFGQLGYGNVDTIGDDEVPSTAGDVDVGGTVVQLSKGDFTTCARLDTDEIKCWGRGEFGLPGQQGVDNIGDDETPADIPVIEVGGAVAYVDAGRDFNCALLVNGAVRCWGSGVMLGYGGTEHVGDDETPADAGDVEVF
ncbi:MAG: hypothetical protein AAF721_08315 [Myxococcota bacterium]